MATVDTSTMWVEQLREILGKRSTKSITSHNREVLDLLTACEELKAHLPQGFDLDACASEYDTIVSDVEGTTSKKEVERADKKLKELRDRLNTAKKSAEKIKKSTDKAAQLSKSAAHKQADTKLAQLEKRLEVFALQFSGADFQVQDYLTDLQTARDLPATAWTDGTALKDLESLETMVAYAEKTVSLFVKRWKTMRSAAEKELESFKKHWSVALYREFSATFDRANLLAINPAARDPHQAESQLAELVSKIKTEAERQQAAKLVYDERLKASEKLFESLQELGSPLVCSDYGQRILHLRNYKTEKNFGEAVDLLQTWTTEVSELLDDLRNAKDLWDRSHAQVTSRLHFFKQNEFVQKNKYMVQHRERDLAVAESFIDLDKNYPLGAAALDKLLKDIADNEQQALELSDTGDYWEQEHLPVAEKILADFQLLLTEVETKWKQDDYSTKGEYDEGRRWQTELKNLLLAPMSSQETCRKNLADGKIKAADYTNKLLAIRDQGDPDQRLEKARVREARSADQAEWKKASQPVLAALEELRCLGLDQDSGQGHQSDYADLVKEYKKFEDLALTGGSDEMLEAIANMPGVQHMVNTAIAEVQKKSGAVHKSLEKELEEFKDRVKKGIGRLSRLWNKQKLPEDLFESIKKDAAALDIYLETDNLKLLQVGLTKLKALESRLDAAEQDPQKFVKLEAQLKESLKLLKDKLLKSVFKNVGFPKWKKKRDELKVKVRSGDAKAIKELGELIKTLRKSVTEAATIDALRTTYAARLKQLEVRKARLGKRLKDEFKSSGEFFGETDKLILEATAMADTESVAKVQSAADKLDAAEAALQIYEDHPSSLVREEWDAAEEKVTEQNAWNADLALWKEQLAEFEKGIWKRAKDAVAKAGAAEDRLKLIAKFHKKAVKLGDKEDLGGARQQLKFATLYAKQTALDPLGTAKSELLKGLDAAWAKALENVQKQLQLFEKTVTSTCADDGRQTVVDAAKKLTGRTQRVLQAFDPTAFELPVRVITLRGTLKEKRRQREEGLNFVRKYRKQLSEDSLIQSLLQNPFSPVNFRALYNCLTDLDLNLQRAV